MILMINEYKIKNKKNKKIKKTNLLIVCVRMLFCVMLFKTNSTIVVATVFAFAYTAFTENVFAIVTLYATIITNALLAMLTATAIVLAVIRSAANTTIYIIVFFFFVFVVVVASF